MAESYQGVTKARVVEVLKAIDRHTDDLTDAVFALLDDQHDSWFTKAPPGTRFCDGASTAHIACHVGILQRGQWRGRGSDLVIYSYSFHTAPHVAAIAD